MPKTIVIVGGNAGARIACDIFRASKASQAFRLLDSFAPDASWSGKPPKAMPGKKEDAENIQFLAEKDVAYFVATGDNAMRKEITEFLIGKTGKEPTNCIHPSAVIAPTAELGYGNLVCPLAVIHTQARIGNGTIVNSGAVIEHDCVVGEYAQISPNVSLAGRVIVGELAFVSTGAIVIPEITIGRESVVAAGAVVLDSVAPRTMVAGCPAVFKKTLPSHG